MNIYYIAYLCSVCEHSACSKVHECCWVYLCALVPSYNNRLVIEGLYQSRPCTCCLCSIGHCQVPVHGAVRDLQCCNKQACPAGHMWKLWARLSLTCWCCSCSVSLLLSRWTGDSDGGILSFKAISSWPNVSSSFSMSPLSSVSCNWGRSCCWSYSSCMGPVSPIS